MYKNIKVFFFLFFIYFMPFLNAIDQLAVNEDSNQSLDAEISCNKQARESYCHVGPCQPQDPPVCLPKVILEYAYIYCTLNPSISPGSSIPFNQNGLMTSGIIHSTVSNTDQIIVRNTGIYRIIYNITSSSAMYFAISINGIIQASSKYGTNTGGTILAGSTILSLQSGDILRLVNYSIATTTILSNTAGGNPRISASITILFEEVGNI